MVEDFFHDVPADVRDEAMRQARASPVGYAVRAAVAVGPLAERADRG